MRLRRLRLRTLMVIVAVVGLGLGAYIAVVRMNEQAKAYARKAFYHHNQVQWATAGAAICDEQAAKDRATAKSDPDPWYPRRARWAAEQAAWYRGHAERSRRLSERYANAVHRPWISIPPDPPEPDQPPQPE